MRLFGAEQVFIQVQNGMTEQDKETGFGVFLFT